MRRFVRFELIGVALLLAICAVALPASADPITQSISGHYAPPATDILSRLRSTSSGGNNYSLSYIITDVSGPAATAQGWSLTLFQNGNDVAYTPNSLSVLSSNILTPNNAGAYTVMAGKSNNGNGNCNSNLSDAICVTTSGIGSPSVIGLGQTLTFNFGFTCVNCTALNSWDFMSHGTCVGGTGNCYAVTNWSGGPVGVPEPSVLVLLASQIVLMGGIVLVFGPARNRLLNLFRSQTGLTS